MQKWHVYKNGQTILQNLFSCSRKDETSCQTDSIHEAVVTPFGTIF